MVMPTDSALESFIKSLIDVAPEFENTLRGAAPSSLYTVARTGRSLSIAVQTKGLRLVERKKIWNEKVVAFHKSCLREIVQLITMQSKNIRLFKEDIRIAARGIPLTQLCAEETEFYHQLVAQWSTFVMQTRDLDLLNKKTRGKLLPAVAISIEREMTLKRDVVLNLAKETIILQAEFRKSLGIVEPALNFQTEVLVGVC